MHNHNSATSLQNMPPDAVKEKSQRLQGNGIVAVVQPAPR